MPLLTQLEHDAETTASARGHRLATWDEHRRVHGMSAIAHCRSCPSWVFVVTDPDPNQIDIGGPAVAVNCRMEVH